MNAATTTSRTMTHEELPPIAEQQAALIRYRLRTMLTSLQEIERQAPTIGTFELETSALKLSTELRAIARATADQDLVLTVAHIQDELEEILPFQGPSREKLLLGLSTVRSMLAELI